MLDDIKSLVSNQIDQIKTIISLIKLETRLAGLSIFPLIVASCCLLVTLFCLWLAIMVLIGFGAYQAIHSGAVSILIVLLINVLASGLLLKRMKLYLNHMSFSTTRTLLNQPKDDIKREDKTRVDE